MRTTVVYILRLLVDETEAGVLHGILRDVTSGEQYAFSSEQSLLELLHSQLFPNLKITDANKTFHPWRDEA